MACQQLRVAGARHHLLVVFWVVELRDGGVAHPSVPVPDGQPALPLPAMIVSKRRRPISAPGEALSAIGPTARQLTVARSNHTVCGSLHPTSRRHRRRRIQCRRRHLW